ncbi:ATP-binding protein [Streptomyces sp. NPDC047082]|uniref:AlbA family DNA-binding domain-containing protein n=1 Tax=Streptomyces sp. NPDC047082 TaxID=3155259 RepID=UPI003410606F
MSGREVTEETLRALLDQQAEGEALDYKRTCDLALLQDEVEMAKDIAAFQAFGGHLVYGADGQGRPTGELEDRQITLFDEANLSSKMRKYMAEPLALKSAAHRIDGALVIVVHVAPHPDGFTIMRAQGQYPVTNSRGKQENKCVFRPGDVFIRRGTQSDKWQPQDRERLLARRDARRREEQRAEFARTLAEIQDAQQGSRLAAAPAMTLTWNVDADSFESAALEMIRHNDVLPLSLFLRRSPADVFRLRQSDGTDSDQVLLDRVTQLCAAAVITGHDGLTRQGIQALARTYQSAADLYGHPRACITGPDAATLWWSIIARTEAIGGLAVREERWETVRTLALQRPAVGGRARYVSWLRHGLTHAARDGVLPNEERGERPGALIRAALDVTDRLEILRIDQPALPDPGQTGAPDGVLDSLCQFDALAAAISDIAAGEDNRTSQFYPNFAGYYAPRIEPVLQRLLTDPAMRHALLPDTELATVHETVNDICRLAHRLGFGTGWDFEDLQLPETAPPNT